MKKDDRKRSDVVCAGRCLSAAAGIGRDMCDVRAGNQHCSQSSMVLLVLSRTVDVDIGIKNDDEVDAHVPALSLK